MLFLGGATFAQTQKYTMTEAVNGLRTNLAVKNITQFSWSSDSKSFIQAVKGGYLITDIKNNKQDTLLSITQLNKNLGDQKLKGLPPVKFIDNNTAYFTSNNQMRWIEKSGNDWKVKRSVNIGANAENLKLLSDNQTLVYTKENNLYLNKNGKETAITNDADKNILNGASTVHRNEFGINTGIFASPNAENIAFYRMDQTMVADYPIIDWSVTPAVNSNIKYPMAGKTSHEVTLGVYNIKNQTTTFLKVEGEKDQYLTAITWSPDSKYIFVGVLNRAQNHLKMNQYDASTGNYVKTLFEEKSDKYVEPQHPLTFFPNSNTDFIWQSQRTGYNHLFHYNLEKGLIAQITKGDWLVTDILGFNDKKKEIYYASTQESPTERHLYKINWTTFKTQKLDQAEGMHNAILSKDGNFLYDSYSNENTPRIAEIINTSTLKSTQILKSENPLKNYLRPEIKNINLKADDGTLLYAKMILPTDFDPQKNIQ